MAIVCERSDRDHLATTHGPNTLFITEFIDDFVSLTITSRRMTICAVLIRVEAENSTVLPFFRNCPFPSRLCELKG
jgi:hypothetical protein